MRERDDEMVDCERDEMGDEMVDDR